MLHKTFGTAEQRQTRFQLRVRRRAGRLPDAEGSAHAGHGRWRSLQPAGAAADWLRATRSRRNRNEFRRVEQRGRRHAAVIELAEQRIPLGNFTIRNVESSGPRLARNCARRHSGDSLCAGGHVGLYCIPFRVGYGAAAVIAVFHDVLITLGFFSLFHYRNFADGDRGTADTGRLFDERHDRDLRPRARKPAVDAARSRFRTS